MFVEQFNNSLLERSHAGMIRHFEFFLSTFRVELVDAVGTTNTRCEVDFL